MCNKLYAIVEKCRCYVSQPFICRIVSGGSLVCVVCAMQVEDFAHPFGGVCDIKGMHYLYHQWWDGKIFIATHIDNNKNID